MAGTIDEILAQIPAEDLATLPGTDPDTAMDAARYFTGAVKVPEISLHLSLTWKVPDT